MSALPKQDEIQEAVCPACHAPLTQCAGRRKKKVQCPKCLQTVVLDPVAPRAAPGGAVEVLVARELSEIKARLAQLSPLRNRLAEIEDELARLKSAVASEPAPAALEAPPAPPVPPAHETPAVVPNPALADPSGLDPRYGFGGSTPLHLGEYLEAFRNSRICIVFARGDPAAMKAGEYLLNQFFYAGWTVAELRGEDLPASFAGLALAAGPGSISPLSLAIHKAFAAANIALAFQIDPTITDSSNVLVVGIPPLGGDEMSAARELVRLSRVSGVKAEKEPSG